MSSIILIHDRSHSETKIRLEMQLQGLLNEAGLSIDSDKMPLDEGIQDQLPDQKVR